MKLWQFEFNPEPVNLVCTVCGEPLDDVTNLDEAMSEARSHQHAD